MINSQTRPPNEYPMSVMSAIYQRRAVRDYVSRKIDPGTIHKLLDAAVHAPTAIHEEPWAFTLIQDKKVLNRLSDSIKMRLSPGADLMPDPGGMHFNERFTQKEFNAFYNAETLIIICGKPIGPFVVSDCWLAAENLMLAACAEGLGTCVIGLAVETLNTPEWKNELKIPSAMTVFVPIIVGVSAGETPVVPRKPPEILSWQ